MDHRPLPLVQRAFRQALTRWLDALERHRSAADPDGAVVRRLASGLANAAATYAIDDLERTGRAVAAATSDQLVPRLDDLLDAIRREIHPSHEPRRLVVAVGEDAVAVDQIVETATPFAHRIETFASPAAARTFVGRSLPGMVVIDADVGPDALDWLVELRGGPGGPELPVLVLATDGALRPDALVLGASEFLKKPLDPEQLLRAVGAHLGHEGRTMLELAGDPITGLPGPGLFQEAVANQGLRSHGRRWCVALVAWRNRATVEGGDPSAANHAALALAEALKEQFPSPSFVARLDQDTFGLLIPDADTENLLPMFEGTVVALGAATHGRMDLGIGAVVGLEAEYGPVLATARRMHHLAAIAGQRVLVTTLDEAAQRRLLLVDDDLATVDLFRATLEGTQIEVAHRRTAIEGLETAAAGPFDVVVLSAGLPNHGAFDVLTTLRGWPHYSARPLLMLTSDDRERVQAYQLGADGCLATPFNPEVVRARLGALLREN